MATPIARSAANPLEPSRRLRPLPWLRLGAAVAAAVAVAPLIAVVFLAASGGETAGPSGDLVARYAATSAALAVLVALGTGVVGSLAAWVVVMHRFPGRNVFSWALALPLAAPAFAIAYGYADLFDAAGPIRSWSRTSLGIDLPIEMRSLAGAAFVLSAAFYPYVYLTVRSAFVNQSVCALEAARTLGATPVKAFWRVALPLARPAIAAGAALAVMETLADYGAVSYLSVQTLTTGVVRAWAVFGSPVSAAQLSLWLMGAAALLLWIERSGRGGASFGPSSARWRELDLIELSPTARWAAFAFCLTLVVAGLGLPAGWLAVKALTVEPEAGRLAAATVRSLGLGAAGAAVTVILAGCIAFGVQGRRWAARIASLGYATPGAVMAIGLLVPASLVWKGVPGAMTGLGAGLVILVAAYASRLTAAALEPIDAGLARLSPSVTSAARTLGATEGGAVRRIQLPLTTGALSTAALLVFIDVIKELPATLILRPFNFDTLAVLADSYASDERLAQGAWPALLVVAAAVLPVAWLSRRVEMSRPGNRR